MIYNIYVKKENNLYIRNISNIFHQLDYFSQLNVQKNF